MSDLRSLWEEGMAVVSCRRCLGDVAFCETLHLSLHMRYGFEAPHQFPNLEEFESDGEHRIFCAVCGRFLGVDVGRLGLRFDPTAVVEKRYVQCLTEQKVAWFYLCTGSRKT